MIDSPSPAERMLVARCLMETGTLIGSVNDIWTHATAFRALGTFRMCIDSIVKLYDGGHGVTASYVKALTMQADGLSGYPFMLDEIAEFLMEDELARLYWDGRVPDDAYPVRCPFCAGAAYIGYLEIDCKSKCPASKPR